MRISQLLFVFFLYLCVTPTLLSVIMILSLFWLLSCGFDDCETFNVNVYELDTP